MQPLLFELSDAGQFNDYLPPLDVPEAAFEYSTRDSLPLPEVDEHSIVRHYTRLSHKNFSIDTEFYPLGSCTMKYNPKITRLWPLCRLRAGASAARRSERAGLARSVV
jgi:glycine dehydrogenase subunit 2